MEYDVTVLKVKKGRPTVLLVNGIRYTILTKDIDKMARRKEPIYYTEQEVEDVLKRTYDSFEQAVKETLKATFGFGEIRWNRFRKGFMELATKRKGG